MRQKRKKGYYVLVQVVEGFIDNERTIGKPEDMVSIIVEDLVDRKGKALLRSVPDIAVIKNNDEFVKQLQTQVDLIQQKIKAIRKDKDGIAKNLREARHKDPGLTDQETFDLSELASTSKPYVHIF